MDNYEKDSLLMVINDTLGTTLVDTTIVNEYQARMSGVDSIETWKKTPVYHNNRTPLYAETLHHHLITKGVTEEQFQLHALGLIPEDKRDQVVFVNGIAIVIRLE